MKIIVIGGGISPEYQISINSATNVLEALKNAGHAAELYEWDGSSDWLKANANNFDLAFPMLHGVGGEDGQIQQILEEIGLKYVGTDSANSSKTMDKKASIETFVDNGILVPLSEVVDFKTYQKHSLTNFPHVLKPVDGGSSIDMLIITDPKTKDLKAIEKLFSKYNQMMLEEYIVGTEITIPVLEGKNLSVIEIIPPKDEIFDFENKYNGKTQEILPPINVSKELQQEAKEIAIKCHEVLGCRHYSRTDMIIQNGKIYTLEINTIPGFTGQSLFPKAAKLAGLDMPELCDYLVQLALAK